MIEVIQGVVPKHVVSRDQMERGLREHFERTTGIFKTRKTERLATAMATAAAKKALEFANLTEIEVLIVVTQTPDRQSPPMAVSLLEKLNLPKQNILTFDINQACCGYVYGLHVANSLLLAGGDPTARALVVTVDKLQLEGSDVEKLIFSDAATATVLSHDPKMDCEFFNDTDGQQYLHMSGGRMHMNGNRVFEYVTDNVPKMLSMMPAADYLIQHQANSMMMRLVTRRSNWQGAELVSIHEYGNASLNSIPLTLAHHANKFEEKPQTVLLAGYGAGWSVGLLHTTIHPTTVLNVEAI